MKYQDRIKEIKINLKKYFEEILSQIKSKNIQEATKIFIPEGID
jgi:hypothetical protein